MPTDAWQDLCAQLPQDASLRELDDAVAEFSMLDQDERAALWLFGWFRQAHDHQGRRGHYIPPTPSLPEVRGVGTVPEPTLLSPPPVPR
jgi:hypothetical protein